MAIDLEKTRKKLKKLCGSEVLDAIDTSQDHELEERLIRLASHEKEIRDALDNHPEVVDLRAQLALILGPFNDALKGIEMQRLLIAARFEQE